MSVCRENAKKTTLKVASGRRPRSRPVCGRVGGLNEQQKRHFKS